MSKQHAEKLFGFHCEVGDIEPESEYRFHPTRKWRFDYAFPDHKIAVEIEGGVWVQGRHTRGSGFVKDMEKYNAAAELGWRVLRYSPKMVRDGIAIDQVMRMIQDVDK